ncbi:MAG: hypothetical protein EBR82_40485 [Caulobacteraceae bacterium]|nr:hypothetical protein [Caulobacteraceae bacterium]
MPDIAFVTSGKLTPDGQRLIAYMTEQIAQAKVDANPDSLNALPGPIKHYYVNVESIRALSPEAWLQDYSNAARALHNTLTQIEESAARAQAEADERSRLSESLEDVKAALALAMQRIAELEAKQAAEAPEMDAEESAPEPVKSKKG